MRVRVGAALLGVAVCAAVLVAAPLRAEAGVLKVAPTQFRPTSGPHPHTVTPSHLASGDGFLLNFVAPIRLPAGARVTKLVLLTWGGNPSYESARLLRWKLGEAFDTPTAAIMFVETSTQQPVLAAAPSLSETTVAEHPTSDLVVRRGYRYYVSVQSLNVHSRVAGVEVHFTR